MFKVLLKKQLLEINTRLFYNVKSNTRRSTRGTYAMIALFVIAFLFIAAVFFVLSAAYFHLSYDRANDWLIFALVDMFALFIGVFGSVFNTSASLYQSKDNELLLSMPIRPSAILAVRMVGVYLMGLLYTGAVLLPLCLGYCIFARPGILPGILSFVHFLTISFLVLFISCLLGWVVSIISSRLKNKSFVTVFLTLVFFVVYFTFSFSLGGVSGALMENTGQTAAMIQTNAPAISFIASAATGNVVSSAICVLVVAILVALLILVLSKSFLSITSSKSSGTKAVYKSSGIQSSSQISALFKREWRHFSQSPAYMLNSSISTILMPLFGILALVFSADLQENLTNMTYIFGDVRPVIMCGAVALLVSMNDITAASVSLEGKNLWIIRSSPVETAKVLDAKQHLHWAVTTPPAIIFSICIGISCEIDPVDIFLVAIFAFTYIMFTSALGLLCNLKRPSLDWMSEAGPVKNSIPVFISIFGGMGIAIGITIIGVVASSSFEFMTIIPVIVLVLILITRIMNRWILNVGVKIFENL